MRQMRNEKNGVGREADWTREFRVGQSALIFLIFSFSHFTLTIKSGSQSLHRSVPAIIGRAIWKYFFKMFNNSSLTYSVKRPYLYVV